MISSDLLSRARLRRQRFDFCPWFFRSEASAEEREEQAAYQALLAAEYGVAVGAGCYLSPQAAISGQPGACLRMGDNSFVAAGAYVTDHVVFGHHCTLNPYATVRGTFRGGDGVRIGAYACLVGFNHGFARADVPVYQQKLTSRGIVLGDDVWVGSHVTVVDGVTVGSHTILAGGAVVTRDVPDYAIVGGNPARTLRMRDPSNLEKDAPGE